MNPKSPGLPPQDDIELNTLDGAAQALPKYTPDIDSDDSDDGDEGALLGPQERTRGRERLAVGKLWPQIQSIVVEVRGLIIPHLPH